jgi:hypothetical protein
MASIEFSIGEPCAPALAQFVSGRRQSAKAQPVARAASIGAELAPRQVVARIDRSLFLYPVGGRYDMLEWL